MKVAILVSMFPPKKIGGVEIASQNIAKCLAKENHEVHVITSFDDGLLKESSGDNYFVHRISYPKIRVFGVLIFWLKCFLMIRKINPELTHSQTVQMGMPSFLAKIFCRIPYVVYCHGSEIYLPWRFKKNISKWVLQNAKAVIVLSKDMKKRVELLGLNINDIFIIPNGINLEDFDVISKDETRDKIGINKSDDVILFVGTLKSVKGIRYLLEAINIIKNNGLSPTLLIVGEGDERKYLEKISVNFGIVNNVKFVGGKCNKEVFEYMAAADMLILPSISEGLPIVILEAMASGLPVVATKVGGIQDIINDGENGILIDSMDPKQIADSIIFLLSNDDRRGTMSYNNRKKAQKYSWVQITKKIISVYSL